ncbi:four helix bundle protein [Candidatus Berkelbacteria bacterium]|nr:four helix bundle protein [Candidatus Berkelbacteria bacterium]
MPIVQKLYIFYRDLHAAVLLFPKVDKHSLGQILQNKSLQLIETILIASRLNSNAKKNMLIQANGQLDLIKLLIRLAHEIKIIDHTKYLSLQAYLQEVGRMLGGWLRSLQ